MGKTKSVKAFQPDQGYSKEDWEAVYFPEMTDDELANARPANEVLPPEFFKAMEERSRGRP